MAALGCCGGRYTFLSTDIWNVFDLGIVLLGWPAIYFVQLSPFRIFILFRLFMKLPFLSELKAIIHSFWAVIPKLRGLFILILVIYFIFIVTGVDLFKGDIGRRCVYVKEDALLKNSNSSILTIDQLELYGVEFQEILPTTWCSHSGFGVECDGSQHFYCMDGNLDFYLGVGSFDTWPQSLLVSFQMISLSGWSRYYVALRGVEGWVIPLIWMIILIFWIVFVVFNIVISAIENAFGLKQEHQMYEKARVRGISNQKLFSRIVLGIIEAFYAKMLYFLQRRLPCFTRCLKIRSIFVTAITSYLFDIVITFMIILNIILDFFVSNKEAMSVISNVFMFIYLVENILRIMIIGPIYFKNFYNILDTSLVFISVALFIVTTSLGINDELYSTIYVIRLVRTVSILSRFPITRSFMTKVTYSVLPAVTILFFAGCVLFMFSTLAHMIYLNLSRYLPKGFDSIGESMLTMFVMLTGDNWEDLMFDPLSRKPNEEKELYKAHPQLNEPKIWFALVLAAPFFILFFIVTNLFLLNFFTAVVLHSYNSAKYTGGKSWKKFKKFFFGIFKFVLRKCCRIGKNTVKQKAGRLDKLNPFNTFCNCFRCFPRLIRATRVYYLFMLCFSILAVIVLVFDDLPSVDQSQGYPIKNWMFIIDCVLLGVFSFDIILGGLADGTKYLFSVFQLFDILFVWELAITVIFEVVTRNSLPWTIVYIRMAVRSIRPLKIVVQFPDLRIYLVSIKNMILSFLQLGMLLIIVFIIYGVLGNRLFENKYVSCSDTKVFDLGKYEPDEIEKFRAACTGYFKEPVHGILAPRAFFHLRSNFDNIGNSLLTLTELTSLDSWSDEMYYVTGQNADTYANFYSIYFISFVLVVVLFVITISIGIVLGGIMEERDVDGSTNPKQVHWSYMRRFIYISSPQPKQIACCGKWVCFFPTHWSFKLVVLLVIIVDYVLISLQWYDMNIVQEFVINTLSFFCILLFCVEDILKLMATGISFFLTDLWNQLDLLILVISPPICILLLLLEFQQVVKGNIEFGLLRLFVKAITRSVLFLRLISFATSFQSVRRIFRTLILAIFPIVNACILLVCIIFGYALLGRMIFGSVRYGEFYNYHVNFREWDKTVLLLLKMLTFDDWRGVMHDLAIDEPYCTKLPNFNDCGSPVVSYLFFISYGVVISTLTLNLFIGIILDNFSIEFLESGFHITREVIDSFKKIWAEFDSHALGMIKLKKVKELIPVLFKKKHVFGFNMNNSRGNRLYWIIYHELQRGSMADFITEQERKETKYLFRMNFFLFLYNFFRRSKKRCSKCVTCCNCCGLRTSATGRLKKKDSKKVSFNKVLLSLARLSIDNIPSSSGARTFEGKRLRRKFLQEALDEITEKKFTRSKTDIRLLGKLKRDEKKRRIVERLQLLRNVKLRNKKKLFADQDSGKKRNEGVKQAIEDELELLDEDISSEEENIPEHQSMSLENDFSLKSENSDVDDPLPPQSPMFDSELGDMDTENEDDESTAMITE